MPPSDKRTLGAFESLVESAQNKTANVKKFTRQIWLAGLGAYANDDEKAFKELVLEGRQFEKKSKNKRSKTPVHPNQMTETGGTWQKLENAFDERLSAALGRLGICTLSDIERLNLELDQLARIVSELSQPQEKQDS